jgi:hypothetical protein
MFDQWRIFGALLATAVEGRIAQANAPTTEVVTPGKSRQLRQESRIWRQPGKSAQRLVMPIRLKMNTKSSNVSAGDNMGEVLDFKIFRRSQA